MLMHVHVLVNAQQHCSCVYRRSHQYRRSHICPLECNVCGAITAVMLSRCRSLYFTLCGSLWTSMASQPSSGLPLTLSDHDILAIVWTPTYSVVFNLCVLATYAPCLQHHVIVSTAPKVSPTSLLPAQSVAVSTSADRHRLCPHCQGYLPAYP